ncbi:MAG: DUF2142 domain-containing protein [Clostridia bacterium]|nr:DUF2142 domain-containing protein [Clostridia bacterium]
MTVKDISARAKAGFLSFKGKYFSAEPYTEDEDLSKRLVKCFVVLALVLGILIVLISPPFTMPDENAHYINICRIIDGDLFPRVEDNMVGSWITVDQNGYLGAFYGKYDGVNGQKFSFWELYFQEYLSFENDQSVFYATRLSTINPLAYIIPSIGGGLVQNVFGINNPSTIVMGAKLASLAFYVVLIAIAIKTTPVLKRTMLLVALMPMSIYQGASISYDAILIPSAILLFALAMKLFFSPEDYVISIKDIVCVCITCAFLFTTKIAYAPLIIFFLAISIKKFGGLKRFFICIGALAGVGVVFYLAPTIICSVISNGTANTQFAVLDEQKAFFMSNLGIIFPVFKNTIINSAGFWTTSFFGVLGNLDTPFPMIFVIAYYFVLYTTALTELSTIKGFNWKARLLSVAGPIIFFVGTIISMYLAWTPLVAEVGGNYSTGTQGRYFIPVVLFCMMLVANPLLCRFKHINKVLQVETNVVCFVTLLYSILCALILVLRFWV